MPTYCTADDVLAQLGIPAWPQDGALTQEIVEGWIDDMEDHVDRLSRDSWRSTRVSDEYYDVNARGFERGAGVPVFINHMNLFPLTTLGSDKLEVWDGGQYVDWVADSSRVESRAGDYWFDYAKGVLYLRSSLWVDRPVSIRLTYRYGNKPVPGDVREATRLFVASKVLEVDDTLGNLVLGVDGSLTPADKVSLWRKQAVSILSGMASWRAISA